MFWYSMIYCSISYQINLKNNAWHCEYSENQYNHHKLAIQIGSCKEPAGKYYFICYKNYFLSPSQVLRLNRQAATEFIFSSYPFTMLWNWICLRSFLKSSSLLFDASQLFTIYSYIWKNASWCRHIETNSNRIVPLKIV